MFATTITKTPVGDWKGCGVSGRSLTTGQSLTGHIRMYNPHAHPQLNSWGQLLISYDINSDAGADLIYLDAYRPKFIRVPIAGLH
jgi:hypothetical protein